MKNLFAKLIAALIILAVAPALNAQDLKKFGSSVTKKVGPKTIAVPYTDVISYMGFAAPGNEDEVKEGKNFYYIYVWIPAVAPEIGVRMMSPAPEGKFKNLTESPEYLENKDSESYFDTYITFERSSIVTKEGISEEGVASAKWFTLAKNDDSSEMPKNPGKKGYNSLLRHKSESGDPTKALTAGLYRIGFTTFKKGEVNGTFLAEVAAPIKLPGIGVSKTLEGLLEAISK